MEVSSEYFRTLETRFVRGRDFSSHDPTGGMHEIIINETLARELWPNDNPVNRSVRLNDPGLGGIPSHTFSVTIVGVVEDMRLSGFTASPEPTVFLSVKGLAFFDITPDLIVNGSESLFSLQNVTSRQVPALMPGLGVLYAYSVDDRAQASHWQVQEPAYFALAGGLAMALVAYIGLYGALAYYVGTRRRELAVRVCLGAPPSGIRKIILARAASCAVSAVILSLPLWPVLAQLSSNDYLGRVSWSTGRAVLISLACVSASVVVSLVPAIDAESVSPSEVLKEQ
jgi:ABC-type antimicrobial peptide transport system permease subunit